MSLNPGIRYHNEIINDKSKIDEIIEEDMRDLRRNMESRVKQR
jgi:hypothetical protein